MRPSHSVRRFIFLLAAAAFIGFGFPVRAQTPPQQLAHDIYKELVEINTVTTTGDTGRAADAMAARLRAAGYPESDVQVFKPAPRKGDLVARFHGSGTRKPILLLAHIDVVEARREDWSFDPFKLREEDGYFYGRGSGDDKFMAATFVSNMIRYKQEGFKPDRDIILALETDEEVLDRNGVGIQWLIKNHRDLIDAEFALNEGGGVGLRNGKALRNNIQTSEKVPVDFSFEVRNSGGHSSVPSRDNAIYHLAGGLTRLAQFDFPVQLNETTSTWLEEAAGTEDKQIGADMISAASAHPTPPRWLASPPSPSITPSFAPPASRRCSKAATPTMLCHSEPRRPSIAASCRGSRSMKCRKHWWVSLRMIKFR